MLGQTVTFVMVCHDDGTSAGSYSIQARQAQDASAEEDAGQVIVVKKAWLLPGSSADDDLFGPDLQKPVPLVGS